MLTIKTNKQKKTQSIHVILNSEDIFWLSELTFFVIIRKTSGKTADSFLPCVVSSASFQFSVVKL